MITVAICTWNRCELLKKTLERMPSMNVPSSLEWELLIVNNNGTDRTNEVCDEFKERLPIRLLQEPTTGLSYARNLAIREARGKYIAWTDDDVFVDRDWLSEIDRAFREHGSEFVFGPSEPEWPSKAPSWYTSAFRGNFAVLNYGSEPFTVTDLNQPFFGLNFAGSKAAHLKLNGFSAEFGLRGTGGGVGEDVDFFERAMRAGMRVVYTPAARVRHMIAPERLHKRYHRRRQWVALPAYYQHLPSVFPDVQWTFGMPRFFLGKAVSDLGNFLRATVSGNASERFFHELQLRRFVGLVGLAAKNGFRSPRPVPPPATSSDPSEAARP